MSKLYFMPFGHVYDSAGAKVAGAQHYFTVDDIPTAPFQDADLTIPHSNPVAADADGTLTAAVYLDPALTYRVRIYDEYAEPGVDTPLDDYDPYSIAETPGPPIREQLTADRTYYVRTTGSDANDGLSNTSGGAFATIQKAIDAAYALDLNGRVVTIQIADGTYTNPISIYGTLLGASTSGGRPLQILGNESAPGNVIVSTTGSTALDMGNHAYAMFAGIRFQTQSGGYGWTVHDYALLEHRNCRFGNVTDDMVLAGEFGAVEQIDNDNGTPSTLDVLGNAVNFVHATVKSRVIFTDQTINFSGNTFSTYLWGLNDATVALDGATLTGTRPSGNTLVHDLSLLNTYSLVNAGGWGFLGTGAFQVEDGGMVTSDALTARIFYVRSDATSDNNDGGENTVGRAFKTIQGAVNFLSLLPYNSVNYGNSKIKPADGTYSETVTLKDVRAHSDVTIEGNLTTPANVIVSGVTDAIVGIALSTRWQITGVKMNAASGSGLRGEKGSRIDFGTVEFGSSTGAQISANSGSILTATTNYSITSSAPVHFDVLTGSRLNVSSRTITLSGANNFTSGFARVWAAGLLNIESATFSGTTTASKYDIRGNGVIWTNGTSVTLPGSSAGTTATGGQYA